MTATIEESPDTELTEFEAIDVRKISGVKKGANGFPHLMLKGIPVQAEAGPDDDSDDDQDDDASKAVVNGKVDQKPDIALGEKICTLIGQAMGNESQEVAAGHHGEAGDVSMLSQAHALVHQWMNGEKTHPDGLKSAVEDGDVEKAKLTTDARNDLSDSDFAIPETRSYPIHDEAHARNALSRVAQNGTASEKARVRAAVHKKYPDIGADDSDDASKSVVAEGETTVDDVTQGDDGHLEKAVADAVTKALRPYEERITSLGAELAKVKATPIPGGPVLSSNARPGIPGHGAEADDLAAKAALMRVKADAATDPADAAGYRQLARELDEKAKTA